MSVLKNFFIFSSNIITKEGEEEKKIMFYLPSEDRAEFKVKQVGLAEGVIKFSQSFDPNQSCHSIHTQKARQILYEAEPGYWIIASINLPMKLKTGDSTEDYVEYQGDDIQDDVYISVIKSLYARFQILFNSFSYIENQYGVNILKTKLRSFFSKQIPKINFKNCNIINIFNGIKYLSLNNLILLNIICLINELKQNFKNIKHTAYMYGDNALVWTSVSPSSIQPIYQYIIDILIPSYIPLKLVETFTHSDNNAYSGKFITEMQLQNYVFVKNQVYLNINGKLEPFYLLVYKDCKYNSLLIFFVDIKTELNEELLNGISLLLTPQIQTIGMEILEYLKLTDTLPNVDTLKYLYYNNLNLALKSTVQIHDDDVEDDALNAMADIRNEQLIGYFNGETIIKLTNDFWIVGKFSNKREFYVAIVNQKTNLSLISDETKKLNEIELKGIFFQN